MGVVPIACTRFCEQPSIAHVGGTKNPDIDAIVALAPDLVMMDREENRRDDADALTVAGIEVFVTHVRAVDDVEPMLAHLAAALGVAAPPASEAPSPSAPPAAADLGAAFVAIWRRPWMTISAATYGSSLLAACGVGNVFADHTDPYPTVTLADVAGRRPDVVVLPSEPYEFRPAHIAEIRATPDLHDVRVVEVDGRDLFWWGTRTTAARQRLADALGQIEGPSSP